jgi:hypothetical protein
MPNVLCGAVVGRLQRACGSMSRVDPVLCDTVRHGAARPARRACLLQRERRAAAPQLSHLARPQVEALPTVLAEWVSRIFGEWYLHFSYRTHARLWLSAIVATGFLAILNTFMRDYTAKGDVATAVVYWIELALVVIMVALIILGVPLMDKQLVNLIWRQVRAAGGVERRRSVEWKD